MYGDQVSFIVPGVPESNRAYELVPGGLRAVRNRERVTGGVRVSLSDFSLSTLVIFSEDSQTIASLRAQAQKVGTRMAQLLRQMAAEKIALASQVDAKLRYRSRQQWDAGDNIRLANSELKKADEAIKKKRL